MMAHKKGNLRLFVTGGAPASEVASEMAGRIKELLYDEYGQRDVSVALVIGVLEIVKQDLINESED